MAHGEPDRPKESSALECHHCGAPAPIDEDAVRSLMPPHEFSTIAVTGLICPSCGEACALIFTHQGVSRMVLAGDGPQEPS